MFLQKTYPRPNGIIHMNMLLHVLKIHLSVFSLRPFICKLTSKYLGGSSQDHDASSASPTCMRSPTKVSLLSVSIPTRDVMARGASTGGSVPGGAGGNRTILIQKLAVRCGSFLD